MFSLWWASLLVVLGLVYAVSMVVMIGECRRMYPTWPYWNGLYQIVTVPIERLYRLFEFGLDLIFRKTSDST